MRNPRRIRILITATLLSLPGFQIAVAQAQQTPAESTVPTDNSIPASALMQPAELVKMLNTADKPVILQVGSHVLYAEAHVPGSEYIGAAGTSAGLQALRERVSGLKKDQPIVLYCGCCPWGRCPNIRPAFDLLQTLGFSDVKALYLAENFGSDWVNKGYPVAKGR